MYVQHFINEKQKQQLMYAFALYMSLEYVKYDTVGGIINIHKYI